MNNNHTPDRPAALQPTAADEARMKELDAAAAKITGGRFTATDYSDGKGYSRTVYGADGSIVDKVVAGQSTASPEQRAVAAAQSSANAEVQQIEREIQNLKDRRDEKDGFNDDGTPR